MSKVEYTEANREKLATAVVENMDLSDMIQALYEQELECYERCEDTFQEPVSYTHLTLPRSYACRSRWSPYH